MSASASKFAVAQPHVVLLTHSAECASSIAPIAQRSGWRVSVCPDVSQAKDFLDEVDDVGAILIDQQSFAGDLERDIRLLGEERNVAVLICDEGLLFEEGLRTMLSNSMPVLGSPMPRLAGDGARKRAVPRTAENSLTTFNTSSGHSTPESVFLFGRAPAFQAALAAARALAHEDANVVLTGECGTGRQALSQFIHSSSPRLMGPLRTISIEDVGSLAAEVLLFGHERGAFVGAFNSEAGLLEQCRGGTLVIDRIDLLEARLQDALQKALVTKRLRRFGGRCDINIDVRVIGLAPVALDQLVAEETFTAGLYSCFADRQISLPSLHERPEDIPLIANRMLAAISPSLGRDALQLDEEAMRWLQERSWSGNVRQLYSVVCHAAALTRTQQLTRRDFERTHADRSPFGSTLSDEDGTLPLFGQDGHIRPLVEIEDEVMQLAIEHYRGSMTKAARHLGVGRSTLYRKYSKY